MNKWKTILPIAVSLTIAVSGSYFLYQWVKTKTAPQQVVKVASKAIPIAVAVLDLPWGTKLTPEMIKTAPFLEESLPAGYSTDVDTLKGRVLVASLKMNDPIVAHRLAPVDIKSGGVSAILQPGKRAIAVKGDKVIGISGFINPGNRVDVLVTLTEPKSKLEKTKTVLENIPVLATGTQIEKNEKGEPAPVDVYTLEVTPHDGEKLALAATEGRLQFSLRNVIDTKTVRTSGATIAGTLASLSAVAKPNKTALRRRTMTVEVIKGNEKTRKKLTF